MSEKKIQGWYSIDLQKSSEIYDIKVEQLRERMQDDLNQKVPLRLSVFDFLVRNAAAFGPFANKKHALAMTQTELDEGDVDLFGNAWDFVTFNVRESLIVSPNYKYLIKQYVCSDPKCRSVQSFKGCCQTCRFENKDKTGEDSFVKTVEMRKWNSE